VYALDKYITVLYDYIDEGKLFQQRKVTLKSYNKSLEAHRAKAMNTQKLESITMRYGLCSILIQNFSMPTRHEHCQQAMGASGKISL
jgi:hypothetical protein